MSMMLMMMSDISMVSGTMVPTMMPVRMPRNTITTTSTMASVSYSVRSTSEIRCVTTSGWKVAKSML